MIAIARKQLGYTLIEILIVLFIISIVTSIALLSIGRNDNKRLASFADELTETISLAEEQALLESTVLGLSISEQRLQFNALSDTNGNQRWLPLQTKTLKQFHVPTGVQLSVEINNAIKPISHNDPQIIISASGELTPFTIFIAKQFKN